MNNQTNVKNNLFIIFRLLANLSLITIFIFSIYACFESLAHLDFTSLALFLGIFFITIYITGSTQFFHQSNTHLSGLIVGFFYIFVALPLIGQAIGGLIYLFFSLFR